MASQESSDSQAERSDRPPPRSHRKQMAHSVAPCRVMTQQSPHSGFLQRAQGPAATAPQLAQCSNPPPSPLLVSWPLMQGPESVAGDAARRENRPGGFSWQATKACAKPHSLKV